MTNSTTPEARPFSELLMPAWVRRAIEHTLKCATDPDCPKYDCWWDGPEDVDHDHTAHELHVVPGPVPEYLCGECFARRALGPQPAEIVPIPCLRCGKSPGTKMRVDTLEDEHGGITYVHLRLCEACKPYSIEEERMRSARELALGSVRSALR